MAVRKWKDKKVHSLMIGNWAIGKNFGAYYHDMIERHTNSDGSYKDHYDPSANLIHTYYDWHLIPTSRPVIVPPEKHEESFEVPGMDFFIDTSEALTGYPTFSSRNGSIEFIAEEGYERWLQRYSDYLKYSHGKQCKIILEDDMDYYYEGFLYLNEQQSGANFNTVTFNYVLEPYKTMITSSGESAEMTVMDITSIQPAWLWDPFNFHTGMIHGKMIFKYEQGAQLPAFIGRSIHTTGDDWETIFFFPNPNILVPRDYDEYERHTGTMPQIFGKKPVVPYITVREEPSDGTSEHSSYTVNGTTVEGIQIQFYNQDIKSTAFTIIVEGGETYYATNIITIPYGQTYHDELMGLIFTDQTLHGKKVLKARGIGIIDIDFRGGDL